MLSGSPQLASPCSRTCHPHPIGFLPQARIAAAVCATRRLSPSVLRLFTEHGPADVCLPDCTQVDAECMSDLLLACATTRQGRESIDSKASGDCLWNLIGFFLFACGAFLSLHWAGAAASYKAPGP